MKGQLVFEFVIAGLIFFAILLFTINYLNATVLGFGSDFYHSRLQSKAAQVAEILMSGSSNLSISDDGTVFNLMKVQNFNDTYCVPAGGYSKLADDFYLFETLFYGVYPNNARILLFTETQTPIECGPSTIPTHTARADVERVGIYQGEFARLMVTIW